VSAMRSDLMNLSDRRFAARSAAAPLDLLRKLAVAEVHRVTLRGSCVEQSTSLLRG